ncbi:hypothetical protein [Sporomusa termitida]|uniref:Type 4 fimbrial biogenesis protein PilX N-terminal domain-containing protein n=1 Tax=Sporomusa termitida TaxID=2377 RepID=A0A517DSN2_9FIRM|nr:hypothetical protein [Sporomusa termitida]QDR80337.1 hypothetical protein SPTER_16600 [Sporomusa termitida]
MLKLINNSRGSAGMLAILAMLFLGIIGGAYAALSTSNVTTAARTRDNIAAQYLAEAGAQWAIAQLTDNIKYATTGYTSPTKNAGTPTAGTFTVEVIQNEDNTITIISTGNVNSSISRTVTLSAKAKAGNNNLKTDIFPYAAFADKNMTVNESLITGDIASNTYITVNTHRKEAINGTAFCNKYTIWEPAAVKGGFQSLTTAPVLDVNELMTPMPDITMAGTSLTSVSSPYTLNESFYYVNGNYAEYNHGYSASSGNSVTIYIKGDFETSKNISGDNITIYTTGKFTLNGGSVTAPATGSVKIYANDTVTLNNTATITGGNVTVLAKKGMAFNGGSINHSLPDAVSKVYVTGNVALNNASVVSGQGTGMLVATGTINLNGGSAPKTIFIANNNIEGNSTSTAAGIYTNGNLNMNGATIAYDSNVIDKLGLSGTASGVVVNSWTNK